MGTRTAGSGICRLGTASRKRGPLGESGVFRSADAKSETARNGLEGRQSSEGQGRAEGDPHWDLKTSDMASF